MFNECCIDFRFVATLWGALVSVVEYSLTNLKVQGSKPGLDGKDTLSRYRFKPL